MVATKYTGEQLEELRQMAHDHLWVHSRQLNDLDDPDDPDGLKIFVEGKGCWVTDVEGRTFLDLLSGLWLKNIGYGRTEIADAVNKAMREIDYAPGGATSVPTIKLSAKLASLAPDPDSRVFLVSGGPEAVETAMKMAKKYQRIKGYPNRYKMISRRGSYHGATIACVSLGSGGVSAPRDYEPLVPGNIHIAQPQRYRCPYCSDKGECNLQCAREAEVVIKHEGPETVAAFIGEPISTAAGIAMPHRDYWPTIREICDKYGVLLIVDEVITGIGRTGKMFASAHWDIVPDIMTIAKALTSGYLPIGAAVARKEIADAFTGGEDETFSHLITFGGHPAVCAAALANLEIIENEHMVENSAEVGSYLFDQLQQLYSHPIVGDIRGGMGLLCGIELVKNRETRESFPKEAKLGKISTEILLKHGLLTRSGDVIHLAPPLCITRDEVDHVVRELDASLSELEQRLGIS